MFGRVRAASSMPDDLELERPSSKIIKDDSLSVYEATLMKLKLGAQRDVGPMETGTDCASSTVSKCCSDAVSSYFPEADYHSRTLLKSSQLVLPHEDIMMTDTDSSFASISPSSSDCQSTGSLKQHRDNNIVSVVYLFSRYRSSGQANSSSEEGVKMMENDGSIKYSHSSTDCQSMKSTKEQLEQDRVSYFPVCQM